jgi:hypothetical protein
MIGISSNDVERNEGFFDDINPWNIIEKILKSTADGNLLWKSDNKSSTSYRTKLRHPEMGNGMINIKITAYHTGIVAFSMLNDDNVGMNIENAILGGLLNKKLVALYELIYLGDLGAGVSIMLSDKPAEIPAP